jgi:uroporphyrinogen-III decarboxylase
MKKLERLFAVLQGKKFDRVPFVANIGWWYRIHRRRGSLPKEYRNMDELGVAKSIGFTLQTDTGFIRIVRNNVEKVEKSEKVYGKDGLVKKGWTKIVQKTPVGKLKEAHTRTPTSFLPLEHPVKTVKDMRVLKYILDHSSIEPAFEKTVSVQNSYGDDGITLPLLFHSPVNQIIFGYMGQQRGLIALYRHRKEVEDLMLSIERFQDEAIRLAEKLPHKIVLFGEHVHSDINNPKIFRKYQIPYFQKRIAQLHAKGKICCCHWDGYFRSLLPLIKETNFDAIQGVTPEPSGDVTLAELREAVKGTKITLWGGLPASIFQEPYTDKYFKKYVMDTLKTVAPGDRFIMDIGDNLGPTGQIHRLKMVNDILEKHGHYPIDER